MKHKNCIDERMSAILSKDPNEDDFMVGGLCLFLFALTFFHRLNVQFCRNNKVYREEVE